MSAAISEQNDVSSFTSICFAGGACFIYVFSCAYWCPTLQLYQIMYSYTISTTDGAGYDCPSGAYDFWLRFSWSSCCTILCFLCFVDHCFWSLYFLFCFVFQLLITLRYIQDVLIVMNVHRADHFNITQYMPSQNV